MKAKMSICPDAISGGMVSRPEPEMIFTLEEGERDRQREKERERERRERGEREGEREERTKGMNL